MVEITASVDLSTLLFVTFNSPPPSLVLPSARPLVTVGVESLVDSLRLLKLQTNRQTDGESECDRKIDRNMIYLIFICFWLLLSWKCGALKCFFVHSALICISFFFNFYLMYTFIFI